eukprot:CAMPEP_0194394032 /NCGR_PEP_ID=MMETSP0174-20130528/123630_1 /TAXON_ID=216777 /ORGANISM="Proboscia alata, Strain PI-D3" /LENGTH=242 /DNA_ID=CAMNT_0039189787 /DNA_START=586 /DNA_END=1315 /DNA_ORIENTATION=-
MKPYTYQNGLYVIQAGSSATKYHKREKEKRDAGASVSAQRGIQQVLCCSLIAVLCAVGHAVWIGNECEISFEHHPTASKLYCAIISHYATCLGDTLASEMGILSQQGPISIITLKTVPHGTNGGVTWWGTMWSGIGGVIIALGSVLLDSVSGLGTRPLPTLLFGTSCGLLGSFLDSLLGATLQASYYDVEKKMICETDGPGGASTIRHISGMDILSNAQVNLVSVFATTIIGALVLGPFIYQ